MAGRISTLFDRILPGLVVRRALGLGWLWAGLCVALAVAEEVFDLSEWLFVLATVLLVLPALAATALCLWATPRGHLEQKESVLAHLLARFVVVVFGFLAWTASIVIGASVSQTIQLIGEGDERRVLGIGFQIAVAVVPVVATLLWLGLIVRCSWFLARLRGWRARPRTSQLPREFLAHAPRARAFVVALAHPGLLLVTGLLSVMGLVLLALGSTVVELTI